MNKSACFTGHRRLSEDAQNLYHRLYAVLGKLAVEQGITDFFAGGAVGFDTIAEQCVLRLRDALRGQADIRLHLVLPCSNAEQTRNWTPKQKQDFQCILQRADSVEYTSRMHYSGCMGRRNARLVEHADSHCICYYDVNHQSGTAQTVNLAKEKGLEIINLFDARQRSCGSAERQRRSGGASRIM